MSYRLKIMLFAVWFFSSCSNEPSKVDHPKPSKGDQLQSTQLLDTTLSFSGIWVNEKYIRKIKSNQSPRLSQDVIESCIVIPARTLEVTRVIYGFHEGGEDIMFAKDGDNYLLCDPLSKKIVDNVSVISPSRIRIGDQYFSRLKHQDTTMTNLGVLEEILFKGRYKLSNGNQVEFVEDGTVKGLDSFTVYSPVIDYATGAKDVDHIQLGLSMKNLHDFGFLFNKDTLHIYKTRCIKYDSASHICEKEVLGDPVYELTKLNP